MYTSAQKGHGPTPPADAAMASTSARSYTSVATGEMDQPTRRSSLRPKKPKGLLYYLFGTSCGQMLMLFVWGTIIVVGGALCLQTTRPDFATADPPGEHDEEHLYNYESFTQCIWFAWGMLMPLPASALAANENDYTKLVAVVFSLLGFLFNLCCLGVVVDRLR